MRSNYRILIDKTQGEAALKLHKELPGEGGVTKPQILSFSRFVRKFKTLDRALR